MLATSPIKPLSATTRLDGAFSCACVTAVRTDKGPMRDLSPTARWLPAAAAVAAAALLLGLAAGSSGWGAVSDDILWRIRVPRVLAGFGAGAALAVAGALMQLLTRNALADPAVLGVSGGASVGALSAMLLGALATRWAEWGIAAGAAAGAFGAPVLLLVLSGRVLGPSGTSG